MHVSEGLEKMQPFRAAGALIFSLTVMLASNMERNASQTYTLFFKIKLPFFFYLKKPLKLPQNSRLK